MSKRESSDIPWSALVLVALLLYAAYNVVENPEWQTWIEANCGWLCQ